MKKYKRMVEIKTYAKKHGLWYENIFPPLFKASKLLRYDKMDIIPSHNEDPYQLFFLHKGCVLGTENGKGNLTRIVFSGQVFGNYDEITRVPLQKMTWRSMDQVTLTGVSLLLVKEYYDLLGIDDNVLMYHLSGLELTRSQLFTELSLLNLPDKIDFLESYSPRLLIELNWKVLASFLNVRPETLSRELSKRSSI